MCLSYQRDTAFSGRQMEQAVIKQMHSYLGQKGYF